MNKEKEFYDALQRIFEGAQIEGEGGYVNLLKIKEAYYAKVIAEFKRGIDADEVIDDEFKEEFYDMLYSFFDKYFSECGSVYFVKTANWQRVYEKVYSSDKDVVLFWKTNTLYYVKSDILFKSVYITAQDEKRPYTFYFDVGGLQQKQNNEKKELLFEFKGIKTDKAANGENDGKITVISVGYCKGAKKTDVKQLAAAAQINEQVISRAINSFKKQTTVDFFINKNANKFLQEQLELFLHQYLLDDDSVFVQRRLNQIKAVKKYAKQLISFIAQFEDELVRIWNKPKFVRKSNYVITLNRLPERLINEIRGSNGLKAQIGEWVKLGFVDGGFAFTQQEIQQHPTLPLDTVYFKELENKILSLFDSLDEALDGRLIHSENYQALNTLQERYSNRIQTIYIDPPFNTGSDFAYLDEYQDSSWLSIMNDRLELSSKLLADSGSLFMHLDHYAEHRGRELLDDIFYKKNFINNLAWAYRSGGASDKTALPYKHDSILFYAKNRDSFKLNPICERQYYEKSFMGAKQDENGRYYADTLLRDIFEGEIYDPKKDMYFNVRKVLNLSREFYSFKNSQKPEGLLHTLLSLSTSRNDGSEIVMDFFAGSGVTAAAAQKMGLKFIGVEMGEHFGNFYPETVNYKNSEKNKKDLYKNFDVISAEEDGANITALVNKVGLLGRMKEVLACCGRHEPCGITCALNWQGGGFFKYYDLEQYEDTLARVKYYSDKNEIFGENAFNQYVFFADEKLADVISGGGEFNIDLSKLYGDIDLPETLSLLLGAPITKIDGDCVYLQGLNQPVKYNPSAMNEEEKQEFIKLIKPLIWWGE